MMMMMMTSRRLRRKHGNAHSCTSTFLFASFGASPAGGEGTTSRATNTTPRRRVMLAPVERDDAHGVGVDVDADEYMCVCVGWMVQRERERERERKRETCFLCGPTEQKIEKNILHF